MSNINRWLAPIAVAGLAGLTSLALTTSASAATPSGSTTYQASLASVALNTPAGAASGNVTVTIEGDQATVTEKISGLADKLPTDKKTLAALGIPADFAGAPFPHVQHIHIDGMGQCPAVPADANGDGVISTVEGHMDYGMVGTTLSLKGTTGAAAFADVTVAPGGGSFTYQRTFTMNKDTLASIKAGTAVVVVHGLNPESAPKASLSTPNSLDVTLPGQDKKVALIATAPALCGALQASQMTTMPVGASPTGGGSTAGVEDGWLFAVGGALVVAGAGVFLARRRLGSQN